LFTPRNKFQSYKLKQAEASYVSPLQRGSASIRAIYRSDWFRICMIPEYSPIRSWQSRMNENERIYGVGERGRRIKKLKKGMMLIKDAVMRADVLTC